MAFLSRGFKNLQWYSMTDENLVTMPVTRFFLCSKFQFSSFPPLAAKYLCGTGSPPVCVSPLPIKADTLDNTGLLCYNDTN